MARTLARRRTATRAVGTLMIAGGALACLALPLAYWYVAELGHAMGDSYRTLEFRWGNAFEVLAVPMLFAAGFVWLGLKLRAR
jgi:hypothetical protein